MSRKAWQSSGRKTTPGRRSMVLESVVMHAPKLIRDARITPE